MPRRAESRAMLACSSGCGREASRQAVLEKSTFHLRFDRIAPGSTRGLFFCDACAAEMLAASQPMPA